jgi:hypothetical protein
METNTKLSSLSEAVNSVITFSCDKIIPFINYSCFDEDRKNLFTARNEVIGLLSDESLLLDPNEKYPSGLTPLMCMIQLRWSEAIDKLFTRYGDMLDLEIKNEDGETSKTLINNKPDNINISDLKNSYMYNKIFNKNPKEDVETLNKIINQEYQQTKRVFINCLKKYDKKNKSISIERERSKKMQISNELRQKVWKAYNGENLKSNCIICKYGIEKERSDWHCAHIVAEINKGIAESSNLFPICSTCNQRMSTKNALTWILKGNWIGSMNYNEERLIDVCNIIYNACIGDGNQYALCEYICSNMCKDDHDISNIIQKHSIKLRLEKLENKFEKHDNIIRQLLDQQTCDESHKKRKQKEITEVNIDDEK